MSDGTARRIQILKMIDRASIEQVLDTAKILEVVEDFVSLRKRGANYIACCPFHNEKTPSFSVSPAKNIYKCFGCGEAGNPLDFVMKHERLSYPDALRYLAKKYNIELVETELSSEDIAKNDRRESLYTTNIYAARIFEEQLFNSEEGKTIGLSYFKERSLLEKTIKTFNLGYALAQRDSFTKRATTEGHKEEFLLETGLSIKSERGIFDRFYGRVIFPIHSPTGKILAFGGRILDADKHPAKYLNSPESEIYHKSNVLYGIFQARQSIAKKGKCYLVEGYMDVLSMHQSGIENVVASCGTSLTVEHVKLIKRYMPEKPSITVLYDGDSAGIKASLKSMNIILAEDVDVKAVLFPDGHDPDSFARSHSATETENYIREHEIDFIQFRTQILFDEAAQKDPIRTTQIVSDTLQTIAIIPHPIKRELYLKQCAETFKISIESLNSSLQEIISRNHARKSQRQSQPSPTPQPPQNLPPQDFFAPAENPQIPKEKLAQDAAQKNCEMEVIRLLISYGNRPLTDEILVAEYIFKQLEENDNFALQSSPCDKIYTEYKTAFLQHETLAETHFINHPNSEISKMTASLLSSKHELSSRFKGKTREEKDNLFEIVPQSVIAYKKLRVDSALTEIQLKIKALEDAGNFDEAFALLPEQQKLSSVKPILAQKLNGRVD